MVPSLTHLSVLAIPVDTVLTDTETEVLKNIKWDSTNNLKKEMATGRELNTQLVASKNVYYKALAHGVMYEDICDELFTLYDIAVEMRNEMAANCLWSTNFVYMDWVMSKILFSPRRGEEAEELYHMLRGCINTWNRIEPVFTITSYTHTEVELYGFITNFKNACFRHLKTMDACAVKGIDEIMEISRPLISLTSDLDENDRKKMFLKKIDDKLNHHVPHYPLPLAEVMVPPIYYDFTAAEAIVLNPELEDDEISQLVWGLVMGDGGELEEGEIPLDEEELMQIMWGPQ
jgi:hypothetical protein